MILLLIDALLILASAVLITALARPATRTAWITGAFVVFYAVLVASGELAGLAHEVGSRAFYFILHAALLVGTGLIWGGAGRPPIWNPIPDLAALLRPRRIAEAIRSDPALAVLALVVALVTLAGGIMALLLPPTTPDSMTYHLSRVGYWLQQGSLEHWNTPDLRQTAFPINLELGLLWTVVLSGSDRWVNLIQWSTVPVLMAAIAGIARQMGHTRRQAVFAALIWATLPQIFLQAVDVKNDLLLSALVASAITLLVLGMDSGARGPLILSGLALGLAAGTKSTLVMIVPGLALFALLLWWKYRAPGFRRLEWWGLSWLAAFMLFSAYNYVLNLESYDNPLGPPEFVEEETHEGNVSPLKMLVVNSIRYTYQMADMSGLPRRAARPLFDLKARAARAVVDRLGLDEVESGQIADQPFSFKRRPSITVGAVWFGPLGIVLLGLIAAETVRAFRTRALLRVGLLLMAWSFLPALSVSTAWSFHKGRYAILLVTIIAPLIAGLHFPRTRLRPLYWGLCGLACFVLVWTATHSDYRPLTGKTPIWDLDFTARQTKAAPTITPMVRLVDRTVPPDATLGLWFKRSDWDYPLFGRDFSRTLVQIYPYPAAVDRAWLDRQAFDYVIANTDLLPSPLPAALTVVGETEEYTLLRYERAP